MIPRPVFQDIAHLGHVELLTPELERSASFFREVIGLHESGRTETSVFLRGWGDYEIHTLELRQSRTSGMGHVAFRVRSAEVLRTMVDYLKSAGVEGKWMEESFGHGRAFRFRSPDGHEIELYYETKRFVAKGDLVAGFKNMPQRYVPHGIAPRRLDHINLLAQDVKGCREFFHNLLGMRVTEQIVFEGEPTSEENAPAREEMGAWLATTLKSYDVAFTKDRSASRGRFHHLTYFMDSREDVLRAADILLESGTPIETGPHKHTIGQTFFLYFYEPGGNRIEIGAGGFLIFDPDWQPVVWSKEERMKGQAWGLQTVSSFHTYGTPPES